MTAVLLYILITCTSSVCTTAVTSVEFSGTTACKAAASQLSEPPAMPTRGSFNQQPGSTAVTVQCLAGAYKQ